MTPDLVVRELVPRGAELLPIIIVQGGTTLEMNRKHMLTSCVQALGILAYPEEDSAVKQTIFTVMMHSINGAWIIDIGVGTPAHGAAQLMEMCANDQSIASGPFVLPASWDDPSGI